MTWPRPDNPAALPELPPGAITWDETANTWTVGGEPVQPGRYLRDGELTQLLDPSNPDDCII